LAITEQGEVWVTDPANYRTQVFGPTGDILRTCNRAGPGSMADVAATGAGRVYVAEGRRIIAYAPDASPPAPQCTDVPFQVRSVRVVPKRFAPARRPGDRRRGGTFRFEANRSGRLRLSIYRMVKRRTDLVMRMDVRGHRGHNAVRFAGWRGNRRLAPGSYVLRATLLDAHPRRAPLAAPFVVLPSPSA
jgi:hypothetical protein